MGHDGQEQKQLSRQDPGTGRYFPWEAFSQYLGPKAACKDDDLFGSVNQNIYAINYNLNRKYTV